MKKFKVALVDDHQLFRDGLCEIINGFPDFAVILEAVSGRDFIQKLNPTSMPDIVLLDINMKEMNGFETASWIQSHHPDLRVLALSMYEDENSVIRMLRAGARGYILKDIRKQELLDALNSVMARGYYYSDLVTGTLLHAIHASGQEQSSEDFKSRTPLNPRELEFLKLICSELTYKEIAEKMNLSPHTIDGYRDALFEKLHVRSRVGLVMYAIRTKIVMLE